MGAGAEIGFLVAGTLSSDNPLKFLQSYANYLNKYYDNEVLDLPKNELKKLIQTITKIQKEADKKQLTKATQFLYNIQSELGVTLRNKLNLDNLRFSSIAEQCLSQLKTIIFALNNYELISLINPSTPNAKINSFNNKEKIINILSETKANLTPPKKLEEFMERDSIERALTELKSTLLMYSKIQELININILSDETKDHIKLSRQTLHIYLNEILKIFQILRKKEKSLTVFNSIVSDEAKNEIKKQKKLFKKYLKQEDSGIPKKKLKEINEHINYLLSSCPNILKAKEND